MLRGWGGCKKCRVGERTYKDTSAKTGSIVHRYNLRFNIINPAVIPIAIMFTALVVVLAIALIRTFMT